MKIGDIVKSSDLLYKYIIVNMMGKDMRGHDVYKIRSVNCPSIVVLLVEAYLLSKYISYE